MGLNKHNSNLGDDYIKVRTRRKQDVCFLNVDLEIESALNLQALIDAFGEDVNVLYHDRLENGNDFASFNLHLDFVENGIYGEPEKIISSFCQLVENLPNKSRKIWDNCTRKSFDIGFESGNTENSFNTGIKNEIVKLIADVGAGIVITIYPALNYEIKRKEKS